MINYTVEPEHLERLKKEISKTCDIVLNDAFPQLQYKRLGFSRIIENLMNDLRETGQKENWKVKRTSKSYFLSYEPKSIFLQRIERVSKQLPKRVEEIQKWLDNFLEDEKEFALRLLEHFRFVDYNTLEEMCHDIYLYLLEELAVSKEDIRFITFGQEAKRDKMIAYHFFHKARKMGLPSEMFLNVNDRDFKFPTGKAIVHVDAFRSYYFII